METWAGNIARRGPVIALALAAGLILAAPDVLAQQRHHSNSAGRPAHSGHAGHSVTPGHSGPHYHYSRPPARIVVAPVVVPRRYYYVPAPVYYPRPFYAGPPIYAAAAPVVIPALNDGYAYFCPDNRLYYPQTVECPSGWLRVVPNGGQAPAY